MSIFKLKFRLFIIIMVALTGKLYAQPTWTLDPLGKEKKPEQYEEKRLTSEKTGEKKFTTFKRIIQNNTTRFNYYFNANNKLNAVIERAKISNKDDYSKLLSFYPYSLENTATQQTELDSVIYKSTGGILLHDLRSDWVDNMYLLIGKAYFFRKEFDSAALTFQFINYNLFPRKKKDDDDSRVVGTNDPAGSGALSIANPEKRNVVQKVLQLPPSRNDALVWLARTFTEQKEYGDAAGMINILQNDRNLPKRLKNDLEEVTAYWFFVQNNYDSAAKHLENALSNADTKFDKSRWEYLLGQLFEMNGNFDKASDYYARVSKHTTDPVMDIYARLNDAKMMRTNGNYKELENSIATLLRMARKDKFEPYRDIIYYSTAQLSLQKPDTTSGILYYTKSIDYNLNNSPYKNRSFLQLANIAYDRKQYKDAYRYYDSLTLDVKEFEDQAVMLAERKENLSKLVQRILVIEKEDSLQLIAGLPAAERDALIRKMVKKFRKENGIKEEDNFEGNTLITFNSKNSAPVDLFPSNAKGEWYFYNGNMRSRGYSDFRGKWGKRTNVDNWRRRSAADAAVKTAAQGIASANPDDPYPANATGIAGSKDGTTNAATQEFSYDALMGGLPLTPEKIDSSNSIIASNLLSLAKIFQNDLQDYPEAINTYNEYLRRFPASKDEPEVLLGLYYSSSKMGNTAAAANYKSALTTKFPASKFSDMIMNPSLLQPDKKNDEVTARYAGIYDMFIEGKFEEAIAAKKRADSVYGSNYWSPQLLYIEAVYHVKQKNDTVAIALLNDLQTRYPSSPLTDKAAALVNVLGRRAEIETYLTNLEITRAEEEKLVVVDDKPISAPQKPAAVVVPPPVVKAAPQIPTQQIIKDSIKTPPVFINGAFTLDLKKPHFVVMLLDKVDGVYINEARNAFSRFNRESYYTQNVVITRDALDPEKTMLLFSPFETADAAIVYMDKIKKAAPREVSWLQPAKYSFLIISDANLQLLKTNKDLQAYRQLLNTNFGNKF